MSTYLEGLANSGLILEARVMVDLYPAIKGGATVERVSPYHWRWSCEHGCEDGVYSIGTSEPMDPTNPQFQQRWEHPALMTLNNSAAAHQGQCKGKK